MGEDRLNDGRAKSFEAHIVARAAPAAAAIATKARWKPRSERGKVGAIGHSWNG